MGKVNAKYIRRNDRQPYYYGKVRDSDGDAVDLTGATVVATMVNESTKVAKFTSQSCTLNADPTTGKFYYPWASGDTDTAGRYNIEFQITPASGGKFTVPAQGKAIVIIKKDLDAT